MGEGQDARAGRKCVGKKLDKLPGIGRTRGRGDALDVQAKPRGPHIPGHVVRGMVLVPEDHLVARLERQAVVDRIVRLAGVANERNFVRRHSQMVGDLAARRFELLRELGPVLKRAVGVDIARPFGHLIGNDPRRGAQVGCVHRHLVLGKCELLAHRLPVVFAARCSGL